MGSENANGDGSLRHVRWFVVAMVVVGGALPLVLYWLMLGSVAAVTPQRAVELLRRDPNTAVLLDVRKPEQFSAGHIDGAVNWALEELLSVSDADKMPPRFRGKTLLLVCDVGATSCLAARHLAGAGIEPAVNVRGGIQEWIHSTRRRDGEIYERWRNASDQVEPFPFRESPCLEQALAVIAFFLIKPIYTLIALMLVILLWRSRSPDLTALRWAMIFFFLGENACAANYLALKETSYLLEYLHSYGMLLCFGFAAYAVFEGLDRRVLMLSDPERRCAALPLCGSCIKHADVPCGLKRMFYFILPVMIVLSATLPTADWQDTSYNTLVFGQLYNYAHLRIYQLFENGYCATAAILMFTLSLLMLAFEREGAVAKAKIAFAAGLGPFGFGMLRMLLGSAYDENRVWYLFWEETTELLFILGICFVLWTFRRRLLPALVPARHD
ncbi:MAG: rhodanese-like domain-containing protein [Planctomycetes bacterium]|nr:rhodanese-like domain-containing protein [Planctomycetota bacterium]MBL7038537.1 rhodanese-like domain-containing protein [Pirellulaceae bacterium]